MKMNNNTVTDYFIRIYRKKFHYKVEIGRKKQYQRSIAFTAALQTSIEIVMYTDKINNINICLLDTIFTFCVLKSMPKYVSSAAEVIFIVLLYFSAYRFVSQQKIYGYIGIGIQFRFISFLFYYFVITNKSLSRILFYLKLDKIG